MQIWMKLKPWQRGALIGGVLHIVVALFLMWASNVEGGGLFLVLIVVEGPWLLLLRVAGFEGVASILVVPQIPLIVGTLFYILIGALIAALVDRYRTRV